MLGPTGTHQQKGTNMSGQQRVPRRTVATGAAWAVPVIAVGAAAPIATASPPPPPQYTGTNCKEPGASNDKDNPKGYRVYFTGLAGFSSAVCAELPGVVDLHPEYVVAHGPDSSNTLLTFTFFDVGGNPVNVTVSVTDWHPCQSV